MNAETPYEKAMREMWEARERCHQRIERGDRLQRVLYWLLGASVALYVVASVVSLLKAKS